MRNRSAAVQRAAVQAMAEGARANPAAAGAGERMYREISGAAREKGGLAPGAPSFGRGSGSLRQAAGRALGSADRRPRDGERRRAGDRRLRQEPNRRAVLDAEDGRKARRDEPPARTRRRQAEKKRCRPGRRTLPHRCHASWSLLASSPPRWSRDKLTDRQAFKAAGDTGRHLPHAAGSGAGWRPIAGSADPSPHAQPDCACGIRAAVACGQPRNCSFPIQPASATQRP